MKKIPRINITPLLFRDVEDLAHFSKKYKARNGEGLFARVTIITAVMALEHFIDLYLNMVRDEKKKKKLQDNIKLWKKAKRTRTTLEAKWYVVTDYFTPGRFQDNVPPFSELRELVKLRNALVHLSQKQVKSRIRGGLPQLLAKLNSAKAEWACRITKEMVAGIFALAGKHPPGWMNP